MPALIALVSRYWSALLVGLAAVAGITAWRQRKQQGRLERDAEIVAHDAALQQQMAKVEKPTETQVQSRLRDGSA